MSLATNVANLATRVATEFKAIRTVTGALSALPTTEKSSLVATIDEVKQATAQAVAQINDTTVGAGTVYSSSKTESRITTAVAALVNSPPAAVDTLAQLSTALGGDANFATTATAPGDRVRVDAAQSVTGTQQTQARIISDGAAATDLGDPATNDAATFESGVA